MNLIDVFLKYKCEEDFLKDLNKNLLQLMLNNPKFIYIDNAGCMCQYHTGPKSNPTKCNGCIIGQALQLMGWSNIEEMKVERSVETLFRSLLNIKCPNNIILIQNKQDCGSKWGDLINMVDV